MNQENKTKIKNRKELIKEIIIVTLILIVAFAIRFSTYKQDFFDYDAYVHYSIVEQALQNNKLPLTNQLDNCPSGINVQHPIGLYLPPYLLGKIMDLKIAFGLSSALFGIITIFLIYLIMRKIFNKRSAIIGIIFLSLTLAHISRSNAAYYRGENLILPFMLLSIIFAIKFLTEKRKKLYATLAGIISASTALFWPGYIYATTIYAAGVTLFILYEFIKKQDIKENTKFAIISLIIQFLIIQIIQWILLGKEQWNISIYYCIISLGAIILLITLYFLRNIKQKRINRLILISGIMVGLTILLLLIFKTNLTQIFSGGGLIRPEQLFYKYIMELQSITLKQLYSYFWIIPLFSLAGLAISYSKIDNKKIMLLGLILPSIYLLTTTTRFVFLASIIIVPISGVFFDWLINKINKKLAYAILIFSILLLTTHTMLLFMSEKPIADQNTIKTLEYFKENTQEKSCLITIHDWGGLIQYYAKRPSYTSSTNQNMLRFNKLNEFLLTNNPPTIGIKNSYIGLMPGDYAKLDSLIRTNLFTISTTENQEIDYLTLTKKETIGEKTHESYKSINHNKEFFATITKDTIIIRKQDYENEDNSSIKNVFFEYNNKVYLIKNENAKDKGCVYLSDYLNFYFNKDLCETNIIKMLTQQKIEGLELWYSGNGARIYKIIN